jgi:hypothetical protein
MGSRIAYPGQTGLEFFRGEIAYKSTGPQADLVLEGIVGETLTRTEDGLAPVAAGEVFGAVHVLFGGTCVAADTVLDGNTISLVPEDGYVISRGAVEAVTLTCDLLPDAQTGNYLVSFNDSTFMTLLDHDLGTDVMPVLAGTGYPLLTADISITASGNLTGSFVNWPNPFNPDEEVTNLGFVLPEDAVLDIEIFSITGDLVRTLVVGASRNKGPSDGDQWNGENDSGTLVLPGTYFCRIKAEYPSGGSEEAIRRVAVIR